MARPTKEEATVLLDEILDRFTLPRTDFAVRLIEFVDRVRAAAPTAAAVERDAQRRRKARKADQTG